MKSDDNRLLQHLVIAVLVKLVVLSVLWWAFVRDDRISIDTDRAAAHLGSSTTSGASP